MTQIGSTLVGDTPFAAKRTETPSVVNSFNLEQDALEPIAVIGYSASFPGDATSAETFWQLLSEGRSAMTEVPNDRFDINSFYHPDPNRPDSLNAKGGHFLRGDISAFDAPFFSIPRSEAVSIDPQQRGLLESVYKALENSGIPLEYAAGSRTGVYVGCFGHEYDAILSRDPDLPSKYQASGSGSAMLANRLSWFYDFIGPSITIDTACSGSLTALHLACQSLRCRESSAAIVAGCNLILNPDTVGIPLSNLNFLSADSRCYSFDHRANGYSRGEGFGVVVIKPLSEAVRDGNTIRAVVRATGCGQDGRTPGLTQPSKEAQARLIRETYSAGGLHFEPTRFFEAHGTGTPIGDPIEAGAIREVFQHHRGPNDRLFIGAVKSNIGHLEGASGIAGLIKTIQVLEKGLIPPNIWFERSNPAILADEWNIEFPLRNTPWPTKGLRRASINAFGYGGTNAHAVLDDAYNYMILRGISGNHRTVERPRVEENNLVTPKLANAYPLANANYQSSNNSHQSKDNHASFENSSSPAALKLLVWSSADEAGIKRLASAYHDHLSSLPISVNFDCEKYLQDLTYTLGTKRSRLPWKSYLISESIQDLKNQFLKNLPNPMRSSGTVLNIGFVFTGQGAQWPAMGRDMIFKYPIFETNLREADKHLRSLGCQWSLIDELRRENDQSNLNRPEFSQPLCTAIQVALVDLLADWDIIPLAVVGHSSGEIAAAYCAGGLSRESAWAISYFRGIVAARLTMGKHGQRGSMISVGLSELDVQPHLEQLSVQGSIAVGCVNSPRNVTMTGDEKLVDHLQTILGKRQIFSLKLDIGVAYHSAQMNDVAEEYHTMIKDRVQSKSSPYPPHSPTMYSSVTSQYVSIDQLCQSEYWVSNMVSKVLFSNALLEMCKAVEPKKGLNDRSMRTAVNHIIEIGPHSSLRRPVQDTVGAEIGYNSVLKKGSPALQSILDFAGQLHIRGYRVNLMAANFPVQVSSAQIEMLTTLPEYPFNHSQSYWHESRISRNFRFRSHPRHELLGTRSTDWNPLEAKWRNVIRRSESPWISHHRFKDNELYPGAGMIAMAIEAGRQLASSLPMAITGYRFKDVHFPNALRLPKNSAYIETQFCLRSPATTTTPSEWSEFRVYGLLENEWILTCRGSMVLEYREAAIEVDDGRENEHDWRRHRDTYFAGTKRCRHTVDSKQLYQNWASFGIPFGPTFQTLKEVSYGDMGESSAKFYVHDWTSKVPKGTDNIQPHVIHPTALDATFHLPLVGLSKGGWKPTPTMAPTFIRHMWVSNDFFTQGDLQIVKAFSKTLWTGFREIESSLVALNSVTDTPLIVTESCRGTAVDSVDKCEPRRICLYLDWKPDLDMLDQKQLSAHCNGIEKPIDLNLDYLIDQCELLCLYFISLALEAVSQEQPVTSVSSQKYIAWMNHCRIQSDYQALISGPEMDGLKQNEQYRETLLHNFEHSCVEGKVIVMVGRNLVGILRGEIDALDLLFRGSLMQEFYSGVFFGVSNQKIAAYVDLLAHKNPSLSILEIGAGTGSATKQVLDALQPQVKPHEQGTPRYDQYTYTDISPGFFEEAKKRFIDHGDRLLFKTLDIEKDPLLQGFDASKYDLVIASCVLHATASIDNTLANTRKLLKPAGKLVLIEPCNLSSLRLPFVFGLLPGWWHGTEKHRSLGPLLSEETWHDALCRNKFSGADISLRDFDPRRHTLSVIATTALDLEISSTTFPSTLIIVKEDSDLQTEICHGLKSQLQQVGISPQIVSLQKIGSRELDQVFCIFLPELEETFLINIRDEDFSNLKHMVKSAKGILWVTNGGGHSTKKPEMGLVTGFARSVRSENHSLNFVTLALEMEVTKFQTVANIVKVYQAAVNCRPHEQIESEYLEREGLLCVNRTVDATDFNDSVFSKFARNEPEPWKFGEEPQRALSLTIESPGLLDTLHFVDDDEAEKRPGAEEIRIKVETVGVNFKDILIALGQSPSQILGGECAGTVTHIGENVELTRFKPGDRVCCIVRGGFKTYAFGHMSWTSKIPDDMPFSIAASLPVVFCTSHYALFHLAHLKKGESILIHSAAGGVGQAAIQLAQLAEAEIYVTVGTEEKKELLMEKYNIPDDHIFSSRNTSFAHGVKRMTNFHGADVILNSSTGESLRQSFECIAPLGRFIEIGKKDINMAESLSMLPFLQNVTFASADIGIVAVQAPALMAELMGTIISLASAQPEKIRPPQPLHTFRASEIEAAFRFLQSGKNAGKSVVELNADDVVPTIPSSKPTWYFNPGATYVISGGLGGLGRSIARWMMNRGAKNIMILSRSGAQSEAALALLEDLRHGGVNALAPSCDITDETALKDVLARYKDIIPPIRGCIQGSMVLRDGLFENMTAADFCAALQPKVQGSWNLHANLPKSMDFFVLLSSSGGVVGNLGQSNYGAANTYQDALSRHRVSIGEKCISLNLGLMLEVGFAAERKQIMDSFLGAGYEGISQAEFLAMLDYCCNPELGLLSPERTQIITGLETPASLKAKGLEEIFWMSRPLFRILRQMDKFSSASSLKGASSKIADNADLFRSANSPTARGIIIAQAIVKKLSASLCMPEEDIETGQPMHAYGVDSLVAVELRYWFSKEFKAEVAVFDILGGNSILDLCMLAAGKSML